MFFLALDFKLELYSVVLFSVKKFVVKVCLKNLELNQRACLKALFIFDSSLD